MQLAPQLKIQARDLCVMELSLVQTLQSNLFVPTTVEFTAAILSRLEALCSLTQSPIAPAVGVSLLFDSMHASGALFAGYFEKDLCNIEYRQSEKALAAATLALARWSIAHEATSLSSTADEVRNLRAVVKRLVGNEDMGPPFAGLNAEVPNAVCSVWRSGILGVSGLGSEKNAWNSQGAVPLKACFFCT